jgi:hypothetical protein
MIGTRDAGCGQEFSGKGAKAALHSVANDCAADLLGNGEADAHCAIAIIALAHKKDEAGHGGTPAAIGGEEISAPAECTYADRDLRPRARRAARILRPPTVALRARKP